LYPTMLKDFAPESVNGRLRILIATCFCAICDDAREIAESGKAAG